MILISPAKNLNLEHYEFENHNSSPAFEEKTKKLEEQIKKNDLEIQTLITQEMLKKGFLASNRFYACIAHSDESLDSYFNAFDETLSSISIIKDNKNEKLDEFSSYFSKFFDFCFERGGRVICW